MLTAKSSRENQNRGLKSRKLMRLDSIVRHHLQGDLSIDLGKVHQSLKKALIFRHYILIFQDLTDKITF